MIVSAASAWEIATKCRLGRSPGAARVFEDYPAAIHGLCAVELPMTAEHAPKAASYTQSLRDPFDRMLAAQAQIEGLTIVSCDCDNALRQFGVKLLW